MLYRAVIGGDSMTMLAMAFRGSSVRKLRLELHGKGGNRDLVLAGRAVIAQRNYAWVCEFNFRRACRVLQGFLAKVGV
jgi:hypothetical protein